MEKRVKYFTIASILLLLLFIISMFTAAFMSINGNESVFFNILYYMSQILMYISPVAFFASFFSGIYCIYKRQKIKGTGTQIKNAVKFPTAWFIVSTVLFMIVIAFIILIINMEV